MRAWGVVLPQAQCGLGTHHRFFFQLCAGFLTVMFKINFKLLYSFILKFTVLNKLNALSRYLPTYYPWISDSILKNKINEIEIRTYLRICI